MEFKRIPFSDLLSNIVDNRGKTCPTAKNGIPLIATNCVKNELLYPAFEKIRYVSQETYKSWFRGHPIPGDLIFVTKGTPGQVCMTPDPVGFCIAQDMVAIRADEKKIYPKYLFATLRSHEIQDQIKNMHVGTLIPHFKKGDFDNLLLPLPDRDIQRTIGDIYFILSSKIELLRRQNKTLEFIAQTIFKEWFVNFKVKSEQLKINSTTGLPEGWRMGKLGEEFEIIMGQSPDGTSYNESGEGMIFFQGRAEFQERFPATRLFTTEPKRIAEKFDVLVSVRAPVGDINVAFDKCCIGRGLAAVRGKYKSNALYKIRSLKDAFNKFEGEGTVFGSIGKDSFANIEAIIPDSETIKSFEMITGPIDAKIYNNYSQIQTLSKLRDALLPKLMKGEIRVKG